MDPNNCTARRANLDDLASLKALWEVARLPVPEMEKHLTEFQVVSRPNGILLSTVGLRITESHGLVYEEAFYHPDLEDEYRALLWARLHILSRNLSLTRLWTREGAPFWTKAGFHQATEEEMRKFPGALGAAHAAWLTYLVREEALLTGQLQREFELFQIAQRESTERMRRQGQTLKWITGLIAIGFSVGALVLLFILFRHAHPPVR